MGEQAREVLEGLSTRPASAAPLVEKPTDAQPPAGRHREASGGDLGQAPIAAVQVWSAVLEQAVWVVADDLPEAAWPTDAPVYTHAEVKRLRQVGPDTLAWVQALKELFHGRVVTGQRGAKPVQAQEPSATSGVTGKLAP